MGIYSKYVFPHIIERVMSSEELRQVRSLVLSDVEGDVFEIGFGTGLNLSHYPESVKKITTADINPGMSRRARRRIEKSSIQVDSRVLTAEYLPLDDESFDTVVCTWTLCSIEDPAKALSEIRRILRPQGKFLFVEHGASKDEAVKKWQDRLNPLWKRIGVGCNLNRDAHSLISDAKFTISDLDTFYMQGDPRWLGYTYQGVATKA